MAGKARCFAVRRGEIEERADASFFARPDIAAQLRECLSEWLTLGEMIELIESGSALKPYEVLPVGMPFYEVNNILPYEFTAATEFTTRTDIKTLIRGDFVTGRVGSIGNFAIFRGAEAAGISDNVLRFRLSAQHVERSEFVQHFLNSSLAAGQIARFRKGSLQGVINQTTLKTVVVPVLGDRRETDVVRAMDAARGERRAKLAEADTLLAGLDDFLLATLSLTPPPRNDRKIFAIRRIVIAPRFDPHFHLPVFAQTTGMLTAAAAEPLGGLVGFSAEVWKPQEHKTQTFRYIEIGNVSPNTGEACAEDIPVAEAPSRARMAVRTGDLLVSLTRPHHGSIAQITPDLNGCVASTGFSVLRLGTGARVSLEYLWCILRSKMCLAQMLQRASGGNYPAITESELAKVLVLVPTPAVQETIATEARRRREEARRLRAEAEADWQAAKRWFEEQLFGPALP